MSDSPRILIGVDISTHRSPFTYAALNTELELMALGGGNSEDVLAFAAGQSEAMICINAPSQPNQGLMRQLSLRQSLLPGLAPGRWTDLRVAEYELYLKGFNLPKTPQNEAESPKWMRAGFEIYHYIEALGYKRFPTEGAPRQFLETSTETVFQVWIEEGSLLKATSLEGRLQRQLLLYISNLPLGNPLKIFEEITRHKLFQGIMPVESIYSPEELSALAAAYIGWLAATKPDTLALIGKEEEGQIVLPQEPLHL